jgi:hypothetical protein
MKPGALRNAPHDFAHRLAVLDAGRQSRIVERGDHHAAAVHALEDEPLGRLGDEVEAPVEKELATGLEVVCAVGDFVDALNAHRVTPLMMLCTAVHGPGPVARINRPKAAVGR